MRLAKRASVLSSRGRANVHSVPTFATCAQYPYCFRQSELPLGQCSMTVLTTLSDIVDQARFSFSSILVVGRRGGHLWCEQNGSVAVGGVTKCRHTVRQEYRETIIRLRQMDFHPSLFASLSPGHYLHLSPCRPRAGACFRRGGQPPLAASPANGDKGSGALQWVLAHLSSPQHVRLHPRRCGIQAASAPAPRGPTLVDRLSYSARRTGPQRARSGTG
jgi:hypothetical protein